MISEPELMGDDGEPVRPASPQARDRDRDGAGGPDDVLDSGRNRERAPRPGGAWLWALGGALVASALWAGGLYAYQGRGTDLGGYRTSEDLCEDARLPALQTALGKRGTDPSRYGSRHAALDTTHCGLAFGEPEPLFEVGVRYSLHKVTDPGPEFEALEKSSEGPSAEVLAGVGEQAYFVMDGHGYATLTVLDGQAVVALAVNVSAEVDESNGEWEGELDPKAVATMAGIKEFMVEDVRTLMADLKK
ncbi:hypothetical protein [Streptomyces sp. NPDC047928]|uniref:hypothetical protein n=1 Tax=unclassified Streptomyces TaxID=2593676 RepID=UPI003716CC18